MGDENGYGSRHVGSIGNSLHLWFLKTLQARKDSSSIFVINFSQDRIRQFQSIDFPVPARRRDRMVKIIVVGFQPAEEVAIHFWLPMIDVSAKEDAILVLVIERAEEAGIHVDALEAGDEDCACAERGVGVRVGIGVEDLAELF